MASFKLLGKKRENLISPEFESYSKKDNSQFSNSQFPFKVLYTNITPDNLTEGLYDEWLGTKKNTAPPKQKIYKEKFKIIKFDNLDSNPKFPFKVIYTNITPHNITEGLYDKYRGIKNNTNPAKQKKYKEKFKIKKFSNLDSNPKIPFNIIYTNFTPHNITEGLYDEYLGIKKNTNPPKQKLCDEKFKIKRFFNLNSKIRENTKPKIRKINSNYEYERSHIEYLYHFLLHKNYSINELKEINLMNNIPLKKFHMILDIDSTMIKALDKTEIPDNRKSDDFEISGTVDDKNTFEFFCRYRPYLFHFIHELKDYFHFYISTLSHINYAKKIIDDLIQKAGISIPSINIVSNRNAGKKYFKSLKEIIPIANYKDKLDNTVIIDDIVNCWIKQPMMIKSDNEIFQCIKCLIPCKRYVINSAKGPDTEKFGILLHNNVMEGYFNNALTYSIPVDYSLCIEKDDDSEDGNKGQFYYLEIFMKNCIKLCLYTGKSMVEVMDFFRKKIFENCKFNLKYLDNNWNYVIISLIGELGGEIVVNPDETTHFIVKDEITIKIGL